MKTEKEFKNYLENIRQLAEKEGFDSLDETYVEHLKARFFGEDLVIGSSKHVRLREMKLSDLEAFYRFSDAGKESVLSAFLKESPEKSREHLRAYVEHMYPLYEYGIWTVERIEDGEVIGLCGLGRTEVEGTECTDLGYYICPKCRKQGFCSECIEIVLDYVKNYLEFPLICAIIKKENRISAKVLDKFGFLWRKDYENFGEILSVYEKKLR